MGAYVRKCYDCGGNLGVREDGPVCDDCIDAMRPADSRFDEDPEPSEYWR